MAKDLRGKKELQELCREKYKLLFNLSPETILILDKDGTILEINDHKLRNWLGKRKDEILGKKIPNFDFISKDYKRIIKNNFYKRSRGEKVPPYEIKFMGKKGQDLWVKVAVQVIKNKKKQIVGFFVMLIDITQQKEAEIRHETLFKTAIDAIMFLKPPKWNFTSGNPSTLKMFGLKKEEEFTAHSPYHFSPKYQPNGELSSVKAKRMISRAMKSGSNSFEWLHTKKNGEEFPAMVFLKKVKAENQEFLQATVRDITKQKKREENLRQEKQLSEKYFSTAGVMLGVTDAKMNIVKINKKGLEILGYKEKNLIGENWINTLVSKNNRTKVKKTFQELIDGKITKIMAFESVLLTKKGEEKIFILNNNIIRDLEGKIIGILFSGFDVTQQKMAEKEIREKTSQLEKMNEFFLNREERIIELKEKIVKLKKGNIRKGKK